MSFSHLDFEYIDVHTHFFPPNIFQAIWNYFEKRDEYNRVQGWPVKYKLSIEDLVKFLEKKNVKHFTTLNYSHKENISEYINEWVFKFVQKHEKAIPFGCVWPEDEKRVEYVKKIFDEYNFFGIKIQPLVQKFYMDDPRLDEIYKIMIDRGKWLVAHIGTAPYRNKYVGYAKFLKFIEKYPEINVIVAHMGAFEYRKFLGLLDKYQNLYLDTTMIYIPKNIFPERTTKRPTKEELIAYQDRILFGSDFPNIPYKYENSTKGLLALDLSKKFYHNIFYDNAKKIFQLT
ncbi:MAG: amidohydrolase [Promethearchaeota archaeon]|nr:MAG: amidohydrolase [Candidatus Lokiarchaeota archaeon]